MKTWIQVAIDESVDLRYISEMARAENLGSYTVDPSASDSAHFAYFRIESERFPGVAATLLTQYDMVREVNRETPPLDILPPLLNQEFYDMERQGATPQDG